MEIVLIRRSVRPDKENEFLARYKSERPDHKDFVEETLTKLNSSGELSEPLRSFIFGDSDAITYLNVAKWKSLESFEAWFGPKTMHDPEIETADRVRAVLDVIEVLN